MKTIEFPFDITATIRPDGVSVQSAGTWVKNEAQAKGLKAALQMISMMLENGTSVEKVTTLIVPVIQGVKDESVKAAFEWIDDKVSDES